MTATRDRRSDPAEDAEPAWDDRPIIGTSRGVPWWVGVVLAFGLAMIGAVVDMLIEGSLGRIYQGAYVVGCVGAVCWVRRRSLFGPMVQPPLVFAVTAIVAVLVLGDDPGGDGGLRDLLFSVAIPLTSNFPTMAIATGVTVGVGLYRLWKERDPNPPVRANTTKDRRPPKDRPTKKGGPERPPRDAQPPPPGRRERPGKDRVPPAGRGRAEPHPGEEPDGRRGRRGRPNGEPRQDRRDPPPRDRRGDKRDRGDRRDRDPGPGDRGAGARGSRGGRGREQEPPPPRRRDPGGEGRPRRDDRPAPARRDQGDRGAPPRQPRRRPPETYR